MNLILELVDVFTSGIPAIMKLTVMSMILRPWVTSDSEHLIVWFMEACRILPHGHKVELSPLLTAAMSAKAESNYTSAQDYLYSTIIFNIYVAYTSGVISR